MITPETQAIAPFPAKLTDLSRLPEIVKLTIRDERDAGRVGDLRQELKEELKEIEKLRKSFVDPLLEAKRRIDDQAKNIAAPKIATVQVLDKKLITWNNSQEQIRIDAEKKRRKEEADKLESERKRQLQVAMTTGDEKAVEAVAEIDQNLERMEEKPLEIQPSTRTDKSTTSFKNDGSSRSWMPPKSLASFCWWTK